MLKINKDTKIYIVAEAKTPSGGDELLHQFAYHLRKDLNLNAYMYYIPNNVENPIHPEYNVYNNPFVKTIEDSKNNILVVKEGFQLGIIKLPKKYENIQRVIWWLSVDNFILSYLNSSNKLKYPIITFIRVLNKISRYISNKGNIVDVNKMILDKYLHNKEFISKLFKEINIQGIDLNLCQSYYAINFLRDFGINNIAYLSDYLNKEFLLKTFDINKKENVVIYNPQKGYAFTKKLRSSVPDIKFIPIINMKRQEVIELLKNSKVYIDFGNHPGKDRIPREAAILGCCVITNKRGSAKYFEDVAVPEEYKFDDKKENILKIIDKIKDCFENFKERNKDFDYYRKVIKKEPKNFIEDLKKNTY